MRRLREDSGNTSVMTIGLFVIVLMIVGFGVALTSVEINRNRLYAIADGAALYAAANVNEEDSYNGSDRPAPSVAEAKTRATEFVSTYPYGSKGMSGVRVTGVTVHEDGRVVVDVAGEVRPALIGWVSDALDVPVTVRVSSEAYAR